MNIIIMLFVIFSCLAFPWKCKGFSRTFPDIHGVLSGLLWAHPRWSLHGVMNFLCISNHNTYLSLLDIGNFFKLVFGFDYQMYSERN